MLIESEQPSHQLSEQPSHQATAQAALAEQAADYAELSRSHAARGDGRRAALAAWAADVATVQALLHEADDAEAQLPAVAGAVETALLSRGDSTELTVRGVVESAREALLAAFDESVHQQVRERLGALDHLDDVPAPPPGSANQAVLARLDGRGGEQLVGDLLTAAADCRAVARVMAQVGDEEERQRQTDAADLAGFEAYLVLVSAATGDATLATTDLRWELASVRTGRDPEPARREAMYSVLARAEREVLATVLNAAAPVPVMG